MVMIWHPPSFAGKRLFVVDGYCGANEDTRLKVRFIMEVAWQAHFVKNMFIRPSEEELEEFRTRFRGIKCIQNNQSKMEGAGS